MKSLCTYTYLRTSMNLSKSCMIEQVEQKEKEETEALKGKQQREFEERQYGNEHELDKLNGQHTECLDRQRKLLAVVEKRVDKTLQLECDRLVKKYKSDLRVQMKSSKEDLKKVLVPPHPTPPLH